MYSRKEPEYYKWEYLQTIEFGKRMPPKAFSEEQPDYPDFQWATVAMWCKEVMHK